MGKIKSILGFTLLLGVILIGIENLDKIGSHQLAKINHENINKNYNDIIIKKGKEDKKMIALTFDDGPDEDFTPQILDILKKYDAKATFFVVGQKVGWNPDIVKRMHNENHEIGNHTFTHINTSKHSYEKVAEEINETQEIIKNVTGYEPTLFRPPYRAMNESLFNIIKNNNMKVVLWSDIDTKDWSNPGVNTIVENIENKASNGTIVVLHDYNKIRNNKSQTIQALEIIIPKMKDLGYEFVTVSQIIK